MEDVIKIASYISQRYKKQFGFRIDEMKLHKLLYFTQRECIVQTGSPMFSEEFKAWRYGPVMVIIRQHYKDDILNEKLSAEETSKYKTIFDKIFQTYASKDSWSLSILTHGEFSWKKAREGYDSDAICDVDIKTEDIRKDAERIRKRRFLLAEYEKFQKSMLA